MSESNFRQTELRDYLLGLTEDEQIRESIEERFFVDDVFYQKLLAEEDELIQDFVDDELSAREKTAFQRNFRLTPERRKKIDFSRVLRAELEREKKTPAKSEGVGAFEKLRAWFSLRSATALAAVLLLVVSALGFYFYFSKRSDSAESLALLNRAFSANRPLNSRITGFDYSPPASVTRGKDDERESLEQSLAERIALDAVRKDPSTENLHALGRVYLTKGKFDDAAKTFERAINMTPDDASLLTDYGTALLEKGKQEPVSKEGGALELFARALEQFERALKINPNLPEARFNRALTLSENLAAPNQAIQAWRDYLQIDSTSKWADEARRYIEKLENGGHAEKTPAELQKEFLQAVERQDEKVAFELLSLNRELINQKHLVQNLIKSFLEAADGDEEIFLRAIDYAARLEERKNADSFTGSLAAFYAASGRQKRAALRSAQAALRDGFRLCLETRFSAARESFSSAENIYAELGNEAEKMLAAHFVAYALFNEGRETEAAEIWNREAERCRSRNFKWLLAATYYWTGNYRDILEQPTQSAMKFKEGLAIAAEIDDPFLIQRFLSSLSLVYSKVGQRAVALGFLHRLLALDKSRINSQRQTWRNHSLALETFSTLGFNAAAAVFAEENLDFAKRLRDPLFIAESAIDSGIAFERKADLAHARERFSEVNRLLVEMPDDSNRSFLNGRAVLQLANLERKAGNWEEAAKLYDESEKVFEKLEKIPYKYETRKGKLLTLLELKNYRELENQISLTIDLLEKYRAEISEEQQRSSFFDREQSVYDIAADYEFGRANYEAAYDYLEKSNSRSLLDWLSKGARVVREENKGVEILLAENVKPLGVGELRSKIPDDVQLLQYAVLNEKILIFVVTREKFEVAASVMPLQKLNERSRLFLKSILSPGPENEAAATVLSRELYDLLIAPVAPRLDPEKAVCLIPNKILYQLPFAALTAPDGRNLITKYDLFYAPSANVFVRSATETGPAEAETIAAIGNPAFDRDEFPDLSDLPSAEIEAKNAAANYPQAFQSIGRAATKKNVLELLRKSDVLHFAGHYVSLPNAPLLSKMVLAGKSAGGDENVLLNAELIGEKMPNLKLVVLSACETGVENYQNGEGLVGLSRTFLAAGVPTVVASQWKVDSEATAELMKKFHYFRRKEKLSAVRSLRKAQIEMIESGNETQNKPYFWAAFAVFGR